MGEAMIYYARENQKLTDHLHETAEIAKGFASAFGFEYTAHIAATLHDVGKFTSEFQDYLQRSISGHKVSRGEVIHALQGAKFAAESIQDAVIADILGNAIATHHGGLFDCISQGRRTLTDKTTNRDEKLHYKEAKQQVGLEIDEGRLKKELLGFCLIGREKKLSLPFMLHLLTKALYSCLVDADRCNAADIDPSATLPEWSELIRKLETHLAGFACNSDIDSVRKEISEQCKNGGGRKQGIYTLSVPTGGGKTLSSLRFALEHAREHGLKRIVYVIPYLSILDQTAMTIRDVFTGDGELILEHHSNIELPRDSDDDEKQYRLLASRWDSPIILTTMVQFLETIYSNKASHLRKFHNMSEAVLVFDEIQALPIKCVHLFNDAVNFLSTYGKSTILLCTATQPHLHKTDRPVMLSETPDIVSIAPENLKFFERVHIEDKTQTPMDAEQIAALAKAQIEHGKSTLVILNTKRDAHNVYEQCKGVDCEKAFLTTDLCPAHRLVVLGRLRDNLAPNSKRLSLCVSTQLIEAGVDISFDCVIRAQAGLDSIIQAAGRCNRNKESQTLQPVYVVNVKAEKLSRLQEIKDGKDCAARVFREKKGIRLLSDDVVGLFYDYYFYSQKSKMDYNIKDQGVTIYSLLNDNPLGAVAYRNQNDEDYKGLPCAFQTAAEAFAVIDGNQIAVVVPYGDALQIVAEYRRMYEPKEKMRIMKQLQKYSVTIYSDDVNNIRQGAEIVDDTFYLLSPDYYDKEVGLKREAMMSFMNA